MYNPNFYRGMRPRPYGGNNRFAGGFAVPFVLGGITGGLLAPAFYPRPYYYGSGALIFKKKINENMAYIKLKIEIGNFGEETVCLSFHKSYRR